MIPAPRATKAGATGSVEAAQPQMGSEVVVSHLPAGFDVTEWTRAACERSGVPFAVADPVALRKLTHLMRHPA